MVRAVSVRLLRFCMPPQKFFGLPTRQPLRFWCSVVFVFGPCSFACVPEWLLLGLIRTEIGFNTDGSMWGLLSMRHKPFLCALTKDNHRVDGVVPVPGDELPSAEYIKD